MPNFLGVKVKDTSFVEKLKVRSYYLWIALVALVLRVIWALAVPVIPIADSGAYDTFARNLAFCNNYGWDCNAPSAYWPVGPSFVYSLFYKLFGHTYLPIVLLNIVLGVVTILLTMYLAERWFERRMAALTGILLALWISQIQFTTVLASEQMFTALIVVALVIWSSESINMWGRAALVGATLAAASYVRPTAMLLPLVLMFIRYISTHRAIENLKATFVMFLVIALLIAPWSIRNTQAFGQFVTISTNGGANLWMGNNPVSTGEYMDLPPEVANMNEAQRDKHLKSLAIAHIKEDPVLFVRRTIDRLIVTYSRETISVVWNEAGLKQRYGQWIITPMKLLTQLYWVPMFCLGVLGVVLFGIREGWLIALTHPTVLLWGYFTLIHAVIVAQDRYHFPSIPMIAILASYSLITLLDWQVKKRGLGLKLAEKQKQGYTH